MRSTYIYIKSVSVTAALLFVMPHAFAAPVKPTAAKAKPAAKAPTVVKPKAAATPRPVAKPRATPRPAPYRPAAPTPTPEPPRGARTWALLVGIGKYANANITGLKYPAIDAGAVRDALVDPQVGGIPASNVKLLTDEEATADNINGAVDNFLKNNVKDGDKVVVFLAGHGVAKGVGLEAKSFLLPTDVRGTTTPALVSSAVDLRALSAKLSLLPASQFVVFVDACREDPTIGRGEKGNLMSNILSRSVVIAPPADRPASAVTFFACSVGQRAFEDPKLQHGVFTYWILNGIREAQAADPEDGDINMGRLASFVSTKVNEWAKQVTAAGDFEVEQTPEMVASASEPVILMQVRKPLPATGYPISKPEVVVASFPEGARVSVNGRSVGAAPFVEALPSSGEYTLKVEAPGYEAVEQKVQALDGYQQQVVVKLQARGGGTGAAADQSNMSNGLFQRAIDAESKSEWEVAEAGYSAVLATDQKFVAAYERLSDLQLRRGQTNQAIGTLIQLNTRTTPTVTSLSRLSRAYSTFAIKKKEETAKDPKQKRNSRVDVRTYRVPQNYDEAAALARRAADEAVKLDANSVPAQLALGFSLIAADDNGNNKSNASAAFGKAGLFGSDDADVQFGLGYNIRYFAQFVKAGPGRTAELNRAIQALKKALTMRPEFYEAHRELAYCLHMNGDTAGAMKEYEMANANRGDTSDVNEVTGVNVALAGLHKEEAGKATGENKRRHEEASSGYMEEAKDTGGDMKVAMQILQFAGVGGSLMSFLPSEVQQVMGAINDPLGAAKNEVRNRLRIPGLPF
jgi:hypothetical protein